MKSTYFILDFDSTFTQVEAMEELAEISLANDPDKEMLVEKIKQFTDLAMDGSMAFDKSLKARIALLSAKKYHVQMLVNRLRKRVSPSILRNKQFFKDYKGQIYIISGGFMEFILPVVKPYYIDANHVFANRFVFDKKNNIVGADESNVLAQNQGKVKLLKQLKLKGKVVVIGDGYTDFEIFEAGLADEFFAFTENVWRTKVLEHAEQIAPSLDEILYKQKLPMTISYPKSRLKVLLWGEQTHRSEKQFQEEGYRICKLPLKVTKAQLAKELADSHVLLFEPEANLSRLRVTAPKLLTAGVWGEMTDSGALGTYLAENGAALFGNQYAHTRGLSELALLHLFSLNRRLKEELPGKKVGIIGYGNCGSLLSVICANLGMEVYFYDIEDRPPLANAKRLKNLNELLRKCDVVVITIGRRFGGGVLLGQKEIRQLQKGSILINLGRDEGIDLLACEEALRTGKIAGLGLDRVHQNTAKNLENNSRVMITENLRLQTRQTQENISAILSDKLIDFVNSGNTDGCLNFPVLSLPVLNQSHRLLHVHHNQPGVLAQINKILADNRINITGQYLKTNEQMGYVITDVNRDYDTKLLEELRGIKETIRFRVLY